MQPVGRYKVLVIDDDEVLLRLLGRALAKDGYDIATAKNGVEGLKTLYREQPHIVVLDVMMPVMDGWEVCHRIRELSDIPIIMLTAKSDERDKIRGFELGVDDYVIKPFSFKELIARIGAILHRAKGNTLARKPQIFSGKGLLIDVPAHRVSVNGEYIQLAPTEFRLIVALAEGFGYPVPTDVLLSKVWGPEYAGEPEHVKQYIWLLRCKIEKDALNPELILTERGVGYRLVMED